MAQAMDAATNNCDWSIHKDLTKLPRAQYLHWMWQVKFNAAKNVAHVADKMLHACGGTGYKPGLGIERYLRDGKAGWVMGPTNEVLRQFIGKASLLGFATPRLLEPGGERARAEQRDQEARRRRQEGAGREADERGRRQQGGGIEIAIARSLRARSYRGEAGLSLSLRFWAWLAGAGHGRWSPPTQGPTPATGRQATYQQAEKLDEAGQYDQALALYEQIIAREPEAKLSFCRAGTAAAGAGQLKKAINYYKSCEQVFPDSLLPRAELVKLYQIAGDIPNRDYERNGLLELHLNTTRQETKAVDHYIRDIFPVGQRSVVAWEYFDLTGDWPTRYRFIVIDESDNALFTVALSSSPQAQANAQAILGRPTKARIFHLDLEQDNIITTLKVFEGEPGYDTVKPLAITAILHGESGKTAQ